MKTTPRLVVLIGALLVLSGCATSTASIKSLSSATPVAVDLKKFDYLTVKVSANEGVSLVSYEADRLRERIVEAVKAKGVAAFKGFNPAEPQPSTLLVDVHVTRYDKGNAFARAVLVGLGQIHVDAEVSVRDVQSQIEVARFSVKKTFAWGGWYGATVSVEDVERGFAAGVATGLAGDKKSSS